MVKSKLITGEEVTVVELGETHVCVVSRDGVLDSYDRHEVILKKSNKLYNLSYDFPNLYRVNNKKAAAYIKRRRKYPTCRYVVRDSDTNFIKYHKTLKSACNHVNRIVLSGHSAVMLMRHLRVLNLVYKAGSLYDNGKMPVSAKTLKRLLSPSIEKK